MVKSTNRELYKCQIMKLLIMKLFPFSYSIPSLGPIILICTSETVVLHAVYLRDRSNKMHDSSPLVGLMFCWGSYWRVSELLFLAPWRILTRRDTPGKCCLPKHIVHCETVLQTGTVTQSTKYDIVSSAPKGKLHNYT